ITVVLAGEIAASSAEPTFMVVPSEIKPPTGVALGDFRRTFQPFENWTLICDEDLRAQSRICNIRQDIAVEGAGTIFSWAMAATDGGQERMIVTVPGSVGDGGDVILKFDGGVTYTAMASCTPQACSATIPVGPQIR